MTRRAHSVPPWPGWLTGATRPGVFLPLFLVLLVALLYTMLYLNTHKPHRVDHFVADDAQHYFDFASEIASGDLSMSYMVRVPHRQPLYPLALAPFTRFGERGLVWIGTPNVVFLVAGTLLLYAGIRVVFGDRVLAALAAFFYGAHPVLVKSVARTALTEPLFVLLMVGLILSFLLYLRRDDGRLLYAASAVAGLVYLTRPNGLFIMAALMFTCAAHDALRVWRGPRRRELVQRYVVAVLVFLALTVPSWLPRTLDSGRPFHHGYLTGYLWSEDYDEARALGESLTWRDYVAGTTPSRFVGRWAAGLLHVYVTAPIRTERWLALWILGLCGIAVALRRGPREMRFLVMFLFVQALPLVWTSVSNPTTRVHYAALLPFLYYFACLAVSSFRNWRARIRGKLS